MQQQGVGSKRVERAWMDKIWVDANEGWLVVVTALVFFGFALARVTFVIRRRRWNARS